MLRRVLSRLIVGLSLCAVIAGAPQMAHAIPTAGTYVWDAGLDISGSFTSNGITLTSWNMTLALTSFTNGGGLIIMNDETQFEQTIIPKSLTTIWSLDSEAPAAIATFADGGLRRELSSDPTFTRVSVPEPPASALLSLGLGLLGLVGYVRRQRRQIWLHVG